VHCQKYPNPPHWNSPTLKQQKEDPTNNSEEPTPALSFETDLRRIIDPYIASSLFNTQIQIVVEENFRTAIVKEAVNRGVDEWMDNATNNDL
jgi:hypothetical protein